MSEQEEKVVKIAENFKEFELKMMNLYCES